MATSNRWLLPEGVEEILPKQAWQIDHYQRQVLDMYRAWGYELVIPPLIEYSESLLIGMGDDIDLQSFKVTDQLSGRTLAIRADITPQTARIDAHSWAQEGPTRLCYAGTVLHTRPKSQLASRVPLEVGAELYGDDGIEADLEVIRLMLESVELAKVSSVHLDLGHVGIYRGLIAAAGISAADEKNLFDAFDRKARAEVRAIVANAISDESLVEMIVALVDLHGDESVLEEAARVLTKAPDAVKSSLAYLESIVQKVRNALPDVPVVIDCAELRGYQYHTGLVFAAYIEGVGHAVANGGRYDGIGKAFGRARPATGFSVNVKALLASSDIQTQNELIVAPFSDDQDLEKTIKVLREKGERVVQVNEGMSLPLNCTRELINVDGQWQVKPLAK